MSRAHLAFAAVGAAGVIAIAIAAAPSLSQQAHGERGATVAPSKTAAEVLKAAKDYKSWPRFAENEEPVRSEGHDDMWVIAWHNSVVTKALQAPTDKLPDGSIIVKENRAKPDAAPAATTIMAKREGDWYWIKATPDLKEVFVEDGEPLAGKNVSSCVGCHTQASTDMIFTHDFAKR